MDSSSSRISSFTLIPSRSLSLLFFASNSLSQAISHPILLDDLQDDSVPFLPSQDHFRSAGSSSGQQRTFLSSRLSGRRSGRITGDGLDGFDLEDVDTFVMIGDGDDSDDTSLLLGNM